MVFRHTIFLVFVVTLSCFLAQAEETVEDIRMKSLGNLDVIKPPYSQPVLLTSIGQGAGCSIAGSIISVRTNIPLKIFQLAGEEDFEGIKTFIVALDINVEALLKADANPGSEMLRIKALLERVKDNKAPLLLMMLSDNREKEKVLQPLFEELIAETDYLIIKIYRDEKENPFIDQAKERDIPVKEIHLYKDLLGLFNEFIVDERPVG